MIILTTYYNPCKYKSKIINYFKFKKELEKNNKVQLVTLELAPKEDDFEINDSIKFIGNSFLIEQKECLISKALGIYPNEEKFAWLDCDIIFDNKNWLQETEYGLDQYDVIQLFEEVNFLGKNNKPERFLKSTIYEFYNNDKFIDGRQNQGHPGFAWAAKRKFINFYRENFIFAQDVVYFSSIIKNYTWINSWDIPGKQNIIDWCELNNSNASFNFLKGTINHLHHGSWENRGYNKRNYLIRSLQNKIYLKNGIFDCSDDVVIYFKNFIKKRLDDGEKFL